MIRLPALVLMLAVMALSLPVAAQNVDDERRRLIAPETVSQAEFALQLAGALGLPVTGEDADEAMRALASRGIEPLEGWKPELPMTPLLVAELRHAVSNAVAAGRLDVEGSAALAAFDELIAHLDLPLADAPPPAYAEGPRGHETACDRSALDRYYATMGPPYYTYCLPLPSYYYLYSWVPSPFYLHGVFFSGFFVVRDVHVVPTFRVPKFKHHHPKFSHGVLGDHRKPPPRHAFSDRAKGLKDIAGRRSPRMKSGHAPRAIPHVPDRPRFSHSPRYSEGVLGTRHRAPSAVSRPPAPRTRASMPTSRPPLTMGTGIRAPQAAAPSASGRGWRHVVPHRR